jgi:signal transduction histidine kinase
MRRFSHNRWIGLLFLTVLLSCLSLIGIGVWSFLDGSDVWRFLSRASWVFLVFLLLSFVSGWLLEWKTNRVLSGMKDALERYTRGVYNKRLDFASLKELEELKTAVLELGLKLEKREQDWANTHRFQARLARIRSLQHFAAGIAQEMQKPMTGVAAFIELAQRQTTVEGSLKNVLTMATQEARNLRESFDRVSYFIEKNALPLEPLDLPEILEECRKDAADVLADEHIEFRLNLTPNLPKVLADRTPLKRILEILIENAREALQKSGGMIEIGTVLHENQHVVVSLKDNGPGIPPDLQDLIFTPFATKTDKKGAGLSLSQAAQSASLMHCDLDFWSHPEKGTIFFLTIPVLNPTAD